ncbi:Spinocerebellar ataxia type 10 protein domain [Teratosphaeria destructans]|uniref:Ataxin-10 homolog n=1 Tax=Teratosphaeria destructans TaxID=418781 RepID=A0A9W7SS51_9PEZI|nr:Spinocerebellar ataxia type 10 protein domain [Teratosphaeria destructans]
MARDLELHAAKVRKAHAVFIRLVLPPYTIHFKSPSYMREATLSLLDTKVCKETLKATASNTAVRHAIGTDAKFWPDLIALLRAAIPSLERRSFTTWDPSGVDYESTSGALIASHYPHLWKDLERLNDLISISRNCLTVGPEAQDLAAESRVDDEIFRLINCCVRVTARGYDGEAGTGEEEKWQWVVNAYKKLLITSLQFLNNFVAQNERRKLMLWISLFDHAASINGVEGTLGPNREEEELARPEPEPPVNAEDVLIAYGSLGNETLDLTGAEKFYPYPDEEGKPFVPVPSWIKQLADEGRWEGNGYVYFCRRLQPNAIELFKHHRVGGAGAADVREKWMSIYEEAARKYREDWDAWEARQMVARSLLQTAPGVNGQSKDIERDLGILESELAEKMQNDRVPVESIQPPTYTADGTIRFSNAANKGAIEDDMKMLFTADAGAKILESGKAELLKRLEGYAAPPADPSRLPPPLGPGAVRTARSDPAINPEERMRSRSRSPLSGSTAAAAPSAGQNINGSHRVPSAEARVEEPEPDYIPPSDEELDEEDDEEEEEDDGDEEGDEEEEEEDDESEAEDDEEEDYPGSTEDGRGLLTDVPLILGPSEIEVLPMLIMSGIVSPPINSPGNPSHLSEDERNAITNMHTVRTHLLLSQSNGRNLLRELLIFVAAWDLREEELYFKFMVKIMEAILKNGLMPYAYHAFRDRSRSKDIISPAQAVIMKLLTCIFRGRGDGTKNGGSSGRAVSGRGKEHSTHPSGQNRADAEDTPKGQPTRVDLHILNFIFTEFRQHIIPQTCALIFLQGQIHAGRASPEDFPLNLWDMERMYEGVYQYLEFFAVLTEEGLWKGILGEWEMASELVTLLRELEGGVGGMGYGRGGPIGGGGVGQGARRAGSGYVGQTLAHQGTAPVQTQQRSLSADAAIPGTQTPSSTQQASANGGQQPEKIVAVERPFDVNVNPPQSNATTLPPLTSMTAGTSQDLFEPEHPLAYPEDSNHGPTIPPLTPSATQLPNPTSSQHLPPPPAPPPLHAVADQDEPSDFEWRNLKKLTVLVLSSLVWKNRSVQDQVRRYGGLEALVSCCRVDESNPYIREHAIMCLRFAVEGCEENGEVIRELAGNQRHALLGDVRLGSSIRRDAGTGVVEGGRVTVEDANSTHFPAGRSTDIFQQGRQGIDELVPKEILESSGYETFVDSKGNVGLRRKDGKAPSFLAAPTGLSLDVAPGPPTTSGSASASTGAGVSKTSTAPSARGFMGSAAGISSAAMMTKLTAEKAAELMQSALRELPLGGVDVGEVLNGERGRREGLERGGGR